MAKFSKYETSEKPFYKNIRDYFTKNNQHCENIFSKHRGWLKVEQIMNILSSPCIDGFFDYRLQNELSGLTEHLVVSKVRFVECLFEYMQLYSLNLRAGKWQITQNQYRTHWAGGYEYLQARLKQQKEAKDILRYERNIDIADSIYFTLKFANCGLEGSQLSKTAIGNLHNYIFNVNIKNVD